MSSGFVTEAEIEEKKLKRQEEWDLVRKPEDPEEAPEEVYDHRSLFERLEEQRAKKEEDWEEEHKFKNQFRGLDDDECNFLDHVEDLRAEADRQAKIEERREVQEYQRKQEIIREKELQERLRFEIKGPELKRQKSTTGGIKSKQQQLLMGVVKKRKSSESIQPDEKRAKLTGTANTNPSATAVTKETEKVSTPAVKAPERVSTPAATVGATGAVGLGLLGQYGSDSERLYVAKP